MNTLHYFLEDKYIGTGVANDFYTSYMQRWVPWSMAYFCRDCGNIWARIINDNNPKWQVRMRRCPKHGPAQLYIPFQPSYVEGMPIELLAREFLIAYKLGSGYQINSITDGR